ncbi:glycosyltransferase family A protein [Anaerostipes faecalis]|uniref:glycosyltransferase family A protein n=1 Tax=Anaerostipes faecalis TaxID=2738446 RepID=UPI003F0629D6
MEKDKSIVSLIIPCYNAEKYIERCLESVLHQQYKNIELILVNDGSIDTSDDIIMNMRSKLERKIEKFIYIKQENQGVGAACNNAFKFASGEYVMLLDSDDILLSESIELCVEYLKANQNCGLVRTNGYYVDENDLNVQNKLLEVNEYMKSKEEIFEEIFYGRTYVWPGSYMIRMEVLEKLYPDHEILPSRGGQNLQFLMMAAYISKAGFINKPLMCYTVRRESLSHFYTGDKLNREIEAMLKYKEIRRYLINKFMMGKERDYWNKEIDYLYDKIFVQLSCKYKNKSEAKKYYKQLKYNAKNKRVELNMRIVYYELMNPLISLFLKIFRKLGILC